ncbi:hypothetical protein HWV62_28280 [Athelia sp. TMB]|nr:hypothetical protein HWV62_2504 [Athelia sp. TMB]KAF7967377.1 hypothetical protein HWV62_34469 [Athelia sp. TMB]KAF7969117.1 hypothetical protein HWV62_28280 [Athelia sp. TMB]
MSISLTSDVSVSCALCFNDLQSSPSRQAVAAGPRLLRELHSSALGAVGAPLPGAGMSRLRLTGVIALASQVWRVVRFDAGAGATGAIDLALLQHYSRQVGAVGEDRSVMRQQKGKSHSSCSIGIV